MTTQPSSLDTRTFAIGVLSVTACVLFVGLLLVQPSNPARAIGMNDRSGDYILVTQQLTTSTEGVVVVDAAAQAMLLYGYDYSRKSLVPMSGFLLKDLQHPGDNARPGRPKP
jgi:HAMP domain-containing protein